MCTARHFRCSCRFLGIFASPQDAINAYEADPYFLGNRFPSFASPVERKDLIREMPEKLTRSELRRKMVIVAKKQAKNLERVLNLLDKKHPELKDKKIWLVDDEADLASVRFVKKKKR
jgi:hypothetical protein